VQACLDRINRPKYASPGGRWLFDRCVKMLQEATCQLETVAVDLGNSNPWGDYQYNLLIYRNMVAAEQIVKQVEFESHPILASRSGSDTRYDFLLRDFFNERGLTELEPITCHRQIIQSPMRVCSLVPGHPVFFFLPSIRSFEALSLFYHEIGHAFWYHRFSEPDSQNGGAEDQRRKFNQLVNQIVELSRRKWLHGKFNEILADAFAGLVGGYTYCSSLCSSLFTLDSEWRLKPEDRNSDIYPGPALRVKIATEAARIACCPAIKLNDPILHAWDDYCRYKEEKHYSGGLEGLDLVSLSQCLEAIKEYLRKNKVKLADSIKPQYVTQDPALCTPTDPIFAILLAAARYRSAQGYTDAYVRWEENLIKRIWRERYHIDAVPQPPKTPSSSRFRPDEPS
jgi:hypothetical protein